MFKRVLHILAVVDYIIDRVVGMNQAFGDKAAIKFAVGFYDALGAGRDYEDAYEFGCTAIDLESIPESATPLLKSKSAKWVQIKPAIALENPEGQVPLESPFYIKRSPAPKPLKIHPEIIGSWQ
ncbi:hypothetical protein [Nodularia sp. NIES-3585]|uniref:hypothetical protein n=1 Tax=Nodularia sp. NIES-3585 TaxID=1973477 RepID=UPI000B62790C|nr:hypothetical protein NIES3585_28890 [Nodularia sp. NIES-3585]